MHEVEGPAAVPRRPGEPGADVGRPNGPRRSPSPPLPPSERSRGEPQAGAQAAEASSNAAEAPLRRGARVGLEAVLVAVVAQLVAVAAYGMWTRERLASTLGRGDVVLHGIFVRSMQLNGGHSAGAHLGAPNGQDMVDFPLGADRLHLVGLRLLAELPISAVAVVNLYYLLSFAVVAGVTHVTLRSLGSDAVPAAGASLLFAFLPYHLSHGASHPFLSMYPSVPLALLLAVWVADGRLGWRAPWWRWVAAAVCVVVAGSASGYYAVFGAVGVVTAAAFGALRGRTLRPLLVGGAVAAAIGLVLVANVAPTLIHRRDVGHNMEVFNRTVSDSETYGLRPATLVIPEGDHRVPALAQLGREARSVPSPGEAGTYLGIVGLLGAVGLLVACLAALAGSKVPPRYGVLAALVLVLLLLGTRGGGGYLIALAGVSEIRAWNRTSLVIGLLGLAALALAGSAAARRIGRPAVAVATAVLVVIGLLDQIPTDPLLSPAASAADVRVERAFVHEMEDTLPAGAMVYQLPYNRFPEGGAKLGMVDYDQLRPFVLGRGRLRWSAGGLRGRAADWQEVWAPQPVPVLLPAVAAAGFSALWVDLPAYGEAADRLVDEVTGLTGAAPRRSAGGRLAWFDLRPFAARTVTALGPDAEDVGRAVTSIPRSDWSRGFDALSGPPPGPRLAEDGAVLELRPASGSRQGAALLLSVDVPAGVTVAVESDRGLWESVGSGLQHGRVPVELGAGPAEVRFRIGGAPAVMFSRLAPVDAAALRLLPDPPLSP